MATDNLTDSHLPSTTSGPYPALMLRKVVDTGTDNKAQNDVDQLFDVYPGDVVLNVTAEVQTAEGGTLTFDVGDGSDVDGYIDGANGNSAGWNTLTAAFAAHTANATSVAVAGYWPGKIYTATDTIDVKWLNAADAAKVEFRAVVIRS